MSNEEIKIESASNEGTKVGAIGFAIVAMILMNAIFLGQNLAGSTKVLHLFLSFLNIPISIIGFLITRSIGRIGRKISGNEDAILVTTKSASLTRKYAGCFFGLLIYNAIIGYILGAVSP
jgi:hypothetical protein